MTRAPSLPAALRPDTPGIARYDIIDMHTAGEPVRIVLDGFPALDGDDILALRRDAMQRCDGHRARLMHEPRGHAEMYGALPLPARAAGAHLAVLFMHASGFSTMCGHATIALGRWAVDAGLVAPSADGSADFVLECPCGPVRVHVRPGGREVAFDGVPAFAAALDVAVAVPGFGAVTLDIGYGGAFYAVLPAARLGLDLAASPLQALRAAAIAVTGAARDRPEVRHPSEPDLSFLYGTILTDGADPGGDAPTRNLCVFGAGQIDRSPTGSGVTARMAIDAARGAIGPGRVRRFAGASGVAFTAEILPGAADPEGPHAACIVRVAGRAQYAGAGTLIAEPDDALADGLILRDDRNLP